MRKTTSAIAVLLLAACGQGGNEQAANGASGDGSASVALQPGQYETTVEVTRMSVANMPGGMTPPTPPPTTVRSCLTPEQAAQPNANFLSGSGDTGGCEYSNFSMDGGRMRGTVECSSEGSTMRSTFDGRIGGDGYQMTSQAQVTASGMTMEMDTRTTARRIGDCPAG